jgi:hypothetical protein
MVRGDHLKQSSSEVLFLMLGAFLIGIGLAENSACGSVKPLRRDDLISQQEYDHDGAEIMRE